MTKGLNVQDSETVKTTVNLRPIDMENLKAVSELQGGLSQTETIRRSLQLLRELLEWSKTEGGEIILQKGRSKERIRFL